MAKNSKYREQNLTRLGAFLADIRVYYVDEKTAKIYGQVKASLIRVCGKRLKYRYCKELSIESSA